MKRFFKFSFFFICFLLINVFLYKNVLASSATCTYKHDKDTITINYSYGKKISYKISTYKNYVKKNFLIVNTDIVDENTGNISCPDLAISYAPVEKQKYSLTISLYTGSGTKYAGDLKIISQTDDEVKSPLSNNFYCTYREGTRREYTLTSFNGKITSNLKGEDIKNYNVKVKNCSPEHFANNTCPEVYDQFVVKAKELIIDCENIIFSNNDKKNEANSKTNVDTGKKVNNNGVELPPDQPDVEDIKNAFLGNTTCGGLYNFTFPDGLPAITSFLYTLLKIAIPVILVVKGSIDLFKAAASQKEDEMKKAQKKFTQRLIAGGIALLAFIIVETVINFIAKRTGDDNAIKCVNCFIKNQCDTVDNDTQ